MLGTDSCQYGTGCHNGICTGYGTVQVGQQIELEASTGKYTKTSWLCESYYAKASSIDSTKTICAWAPTKTFTSFAKDDTSLACDYTETDPETQVSSPVVHNATCGLNMNDKHYCRKMKSKETRDSFRGHTEWPEMFKKAGTCHISTSLKYCVSLFDGEIDTLDQVINFMVFDYQTTNDNYALIANNTAEVLYGPNQAYIRLFDSAQTYGSMLLTGFAFLFSFN